MPDGQLTLLSGTLDLLILQALSVGPNHGYGVSTLIHRRTDGALGVEDAALYQALHRLQRQKLVSAEWGLSENNRKAKYYALTERGRHRLEAESTKWARYAEAVSKLMKPSERKT